MPRGPESSYDERVRRERAASFGGVVDDYERGRPDYPDDAITWLVGKPPRDVVDVGAGTGKLTRTLAAHGHRVLAVEPAHSMLRALGRVVSLPCAVANAEALPLRDASVDVVTVAQAFTGSTPGSRWRSSRACCASAAMSDSSGTCVTSPPTGCAG